jgi:hypothetical protein
MIVKVKVEKPMYVPLSSLNGILTTRYVDGSASGFSEEIAAHIASTLQVSYLGHE